MKKRRQSRRTQKVGNIAGRDTICVLYFQLHLNKCAGVAQSVEQLIRNQQVMCSSHTTSSKSIENFGFRCFFAAKTLKKVWVKMWVNCLTHTVTHIGWQSAALPPTASSCPMGTTKCVERLKEYRRGGFCLLSGIFGFFLLT